MSSACRVCAENYAFSKTQRLRFWIFTRRRGGRGGLILKNAAAALLDEGMKKPTCKRVVGRRFFKSAAAAFLDSVYDFRLSFLELVDAYFDVPYTCLIVERRERARFFP